MEYTIRGIPQPLVANVWRFAEPFIKRALDHTFGEISHDDLYRMVMNRDAQLWMIAREDKRIVGAGTTQIIHYPQTTACRIITLAGTEFDEWREGSHAIIKLWAQEQGCKCIENYVRKGFTKKMQEMGYRHRYSVMHMDI